MSKPPKPESVPTVPSEAIAGREKPLTAARLKAAKRNREAFKRALAQTDPVVRDGLDMGAPLAIKRGTVEVDMGAAVPVDPDSKRSRMQLQPQARRVWAPDTLIRGKNPALQAHHHDAATRYLEDYLIGEHGANPSGRRVGSTRLDPWNRMPYVEQRAIRRDSWRKATKALGPGMMASIVTWAVLQETPTAAQPATVEAWAKAQRPNVWGTERAVGMLVAALEVLAEFYGFRPGGGQGQWREPRRHE